MKQEPASDLPSENIIIVSPSDSTRSDLQSENISTDSSSNNIIIESPPDNIIIEEIEEENVSIAVEVAPKIKISTFSDKDALCLVSSKLGADRRNNKDRIRLASFNADWLFPFEIDFEKYIWPSKKEARDHLRKVAGVISQLNADVLFLQEVQDCRALQAIVALLEEEGIYGYAPYVVRSRDTTLGQHVGLLSRVDPIQADYVELRKDVTVAKNMFARFKVANANGLYHDIALIGAHLAAGIQTEKREKQSSLLSDFATEKIKDYEKVILIGDFNDLDGRIENINVEGPGSRSLDFLASIPKDKSTKLTSVFSQKPANITQTHLSGNIIDHILLDPRFKFENVRAHSELVWSGNQYISDHAPVSVEIILRD